MNLARELLKATGSGVEESIGHYPTTDIRWGQIVSTDPLTVRLAGDATSDITISLVSSDMAIRNGAKVLLARVGGTWVIVTELVGPDEGGPVGLPLMMLGQWPPYVDGSFYGGWNWYSTASSTTTFAHDQLHLLPIVISRPVDVEALIGAHSDTSGDLKWGLYNSDSAGWPNALIDSDTTTVTAADDELPLTADTHLTVGIYWLAVNPSAAFSWRYTNSTVFYYQNQFAYQDLGETTAGAVYSSGNRTTTVSYYITHTYEDDLPDPFVGTPVAEAQNFVCGFKVAS